MIIPKQPYQTEPQVTVVIINWNTIEVTRRCLLSLLKSENPSSLRIVVVDNGSTDESAERIAREFPNIELIRNSRNRGFAAANNQVLKTIDTDYALLLNSDTLVDVGVIARSRQSMECHSEVGVMGCRVLNADGTTQLTCGRYPHLRHLLGLAAGLSREEVPAFLDRYRIRSWNRDTERDVDTVTGCFMMVRREAMEHVGLLDDGFFFYGEETDWCRRFLAAGWKLRFAPVGEIVHFGSLSARQLSAQRDVLLTAGLVRLHLKHGGVLSGLTAWLILATFNFSRALYWRSRAMLNPLGAAHRRAQHFSSVCCSLNQVWGLAKGKSGI